THPPVMTERRRTCSALAGRRAKVAAGPNTNGCRSTDAPSHLRGRSSLDPQPTVSQSPPYNPDIESTGISRPANTIRDGAVAARCPAHGTRYATPVVRRHGKRHQEYPSPARGAASATRLGPAARSGPPHDPRSATRDDGGAVRASRGNRSPLRRSAACEH